MKNFEEWVMGPTSDDWIRDEFTGAEAAWKAALEWVMETGMDHYGNDFLCMDLCKDIRKELESFSQQSNDQTNNSS